MEYISDSDTKTQKIAGNFAKQLSLGDTILLYGELGSGKTTFTKGLAKGLGVTQRIISPTFVIHRSHVLKKGKLNHFDLYRMSSEQGLEDIGLLESIHDNNAITVIEWPDMLKNFLPKIYYKIMISYNHDNSRRIQIKKIVM